MNTFSVITATYNARFTLPNLLDSLASQAYRKFNVIIQDGASADNTVVIAESYRARLPRLLLESTADCGIYDAWNRALARTADELGEWILFLGADDQLASSHTLKNVADFLNNVPAEVDFIAGNLTFTCAGVLTERELIPQKIDSIPTSVVYSMPVGHTALFHRRRLFKKINFNPYYKIAGDYDFLMRTWLNPFQGIHIPEVITYMNLTGISSNPKVAHRQAYECFRVRLQKSWGIALKLYFYAEYDIVRSSIKRICNKNPLSKFFYNALRRLKKTIS